ncbi:MAG: hypothetical protein IJZ20_06760, partial [Clostridia bacterium]|nr:hypothetical protein [Clostridia bacterium]
VLGIVDNSVENAGTGNTTKVIKANSGKQQYLAFDLPVIFEAGRQYELKFDTFYSVIDEKNTIAWVYDVNSANGAASWNNVPSSQKAAGADKWYSYSKTFTASATNSARGYMFWQQKMGVDGSASAWNYDVYYDNISFIPYYKVTYMNWDGSAAHTAEWILRDGSGNILTEYTLPNRNRIAVPWQGEGVKKFVGWSTEGVNGEVATSVALAGEDIVLYPVYEDAADVVEYSAIVSAKTNATTAVYFNKLIDAEATTVDAGNSDAAIAYNKTNNSYVIKAAGYAGVVTINAVFADGTTETVVVKLHGGEKWKPGLNLLTGTTEAYSFNGLTLDEAKVSFTFNGGTGITANPVENSAVNSSSTVALHGNGTVEYPVINTMQTQVIESGRGVYASFDYYGSFANCWLIYMPNSIYYDLGGNKVVSAGKADWAHTWTYAVANQDIKNLTLQNDAGDKGAFKTFYYDNLNFTPAYKFTYVDVDGTETVKYAISDANGNVITSYTPDSANFASGVTSYKLSADGEVYSIDTPIALANEDVVIYAVADAETPGAVSGQEMRFDTVDSKVVSSIRFKGYISASNQSKANEYGFIATRKIFLDTLDAELTFDLTYEGNNMFVYGAAYALDENGEEVVNKTLGNDEDGNILFAAVLTGITNDNADQVNEVLVARPYVKYVN